MTDVLNRGPAGGRSPVDRIPIELLVVMFTERGNAIHLISARKATRRERKDYEERER